MGNATNEFIQIEVPVVNQLPYGLVSDHRRIEEIRFQRSVLPLLKVTKVLPYCSETVAARAYDLDDDLRRAMSGAHAAQHLYRHPHRPGLAAALESATQNYWDSRNCKRHHRLYSRTGEAQRYRHCARCGECAEV